MPEISRFYGIVTGDFPPRKTAMVLRWFALHRAELYENWRLLREGKLPRYIQPLE